jgi:hypothetical protein
MAGETFWVSSGGSEPGSLEEPDLLEPDESLELADAEPPDWLQELSTESAPDEIGPRIYPALEPIGSKPSGSRRNLFFTAVIVLMFLVLVGMVVVALFVLLGGLV